MLLTGLDILELSAIVVRSSAHDRVKFHIFENLEIDFCVIHYSVSVRYFNVIKVDSEAVEYVQQMCKQCQFTKCVLQCL